MTDLPPDGAALFAAVLDSPSDPLPKLVLADWLDERDEPVLAHAFRWCAAYGRHPRGVSVANRLLEDWSLWSMCSPREHRPLAEIEQWFLPYIVAWMAHSPRFTVLLEMAHEYPGELIVWNHFAALADGLEEIAAVVRLPRD